MCPCMLLRNYEDDGVPFPDGPPDEVIPDNAWCLWTWPGIDSRQHFVPPGFTFPSGNVKEIWDLWWFGNQRERIRPFKRLEARFEFTRTVDKVNLAKVRNLMTYLLGIANEKQVIPEIALGAGGLSVLHKTKKVSDDIFGVAYGELINRLYKPNKRERVNDISYSRIAERLRKKIKSPHVNIMSDI